MDQITALTAAEDVAPFATDYRRQRVCHPEAVYFPRTTSEVAQVISDCAARGIAIVPQGGNTGMSLGSSPADGVRFVILNLSKLDRIRHYVPGSGSMVVEAGCILGTVKRLAATGNELLAIALGSEDSCQVGGVLACNAGGENVLRYGMARDQVLGIEAVLADGSVWSQLSTAPKSNGGYDIRHLLCGSEGTLGVITAAVLRLHPAPVSRCAAILALKSLDVVPSLLRLARARCGHNISAFELMDQHAQVHALIQAGNKVAVLDPVPRWAVLIDVHCEHPGDSPGVLLESLFEYAFSEGLVDNGIVATSEGQRESMLRLRMTIGEAIPALGAFFALDTSVPPDSIPHFINKAGAVLAETIPKAVPYVFGHAADGNIHYSAKLPDGCPFDARKEAIAKINSLAIEMGGSSTAEHGVGRLYCDSLAARLSASELSLLQRVKQAFDPAGLLNPGAVLRVQEMTSATNP